MNLRKGDLVFLSIVIGITLFLHLYDFYLPPIWPDEITSSVTALPMVYPSNSTLHNYALSWGYQHIGPFPTQYASYIGLIDSYLIAPFIFFLGFNPISVRSSELFIAIMIVVFTFFAGKELFSRRVGMMASSLLAFLPMFVFYSRQSATYDWVLISFALLIVIFGVRYLKTVKTHYLFGSLVLVGLGVWGYSWFIWFVIGLVAVSPIFLKTVIKNMNKLEIKKSSQQVSLLHEKKIRLIILSVLFLTLGFVPIILQYCFYPQASLPDFLLTTIQGTNTGYSGPHENANFIGNLLMRGQHFFDILGNSLSVGLRYASVNVPPNEESYVLPSLFLISITISVVYIIYRKPQFKRISGLLLLLLTILITSSFTTSSFNQNQLGIMLPFIFLLLGKNLDIVGVYTTNVLRFSFLRNKINYVILALVISIILTQIPLLINGYAILEKSPISKIYIPYQQLNVYLKENSLIPVSNDWSVIRLMTLYTNGEQILHPSGISLSPYMEFDTKEKESMTKLESLDLLSSKYLFIVNIYPIEPQCSKYPLNKTYLDQYRCAQIYFIESAVDRNNRHVKIVDFPLPDGTPYLRTYRILD